MFNFVPNRRGIYYLNCKDHFGPGKNGCVFGKNIINTEQRLTWKQKGESFVIETVDGNKAKFSQHDVDRATKTQRFEEIAAFPASKQCNIWFTRMYSKIAHLQIVI